MLRILAAALFALFVSLAPAIGATPVSVCDPDFPSQCMRPNTGGSTPVSPGSVTPLTPMQSALAITSSTALTIPTGATYAVVCARGQNVNYTTDGTTTPTASVGMQLLQNQCVGLTGATVLSNFRAIQQAATATLDVSYFK